MYIYINLYINTHVHLVACAGVCTCTCSVCMTQCLYKTQDMPKEAKQGRFDTAVFDETIQNQALSGSFLVECRGRKLQNNNQSDRMECDDVIIMSSPTAPPKPRMKLLQFHTNIRPAYYGSWRKKSKIISGRRPIKMDTVC